MQGDRGLSGLVNLGNTCFLAAATQCLSHTPELRDMLLRAYQERPQSGNWPDDGPSQFTYQAARLVNASWEANSPIRPLSYFKRLAENVPAYRTHQQQDSHECLTMMLDLLHQGLRSDPIITGKEAATLKPPADAQAAWQRSIAVEGQSPLLQCIYGQLDSCVHCHTCDQKSHKFDLFGSLSLNVPTTKASPTLNDCYNEYCFAETLLGDDKYNCEVCKDRTEATKQLTVVHWPDVLVLHLKRFRGLHRKDGRPVLFPARGWQPEPERHPGMAYDLCGVVNHIGSSLAGGHYTALCRHHQSGQWYIFDDNRVSTQAGVNMRDPRAYLLVYRKRQ